MVGRLWSGGWAGWLEEVGGWRGWLEEGEEGNKEDLEGWGRIWGWFEDGEEGG